MQIDEILYSVTSEEYDSGPILGPGVQLLSYRNGEPLEAFAVNLTAAGAKNWLRSEAEPGALFTIFKEN